MTASFIKNNTTSKTVSYQKEDGYGGKIVSARIPVALHDILLSMCDLYGYESISKFVSDAVVDKITTCTHAIQTIAEVSHSSYKPQFDPTTDF